MRRASIASIRLDVRAAKALRAERGAIVPLSNGQPDPMCRFLPDTTLTFVNRAYAEFYKVESQKN